VRLRRRLVWPLVALAVALLLAWADGRLSGPAPAAKPRPPSYRPSDFPMTISPARPEKAPPAMAESR